MIERVIPQNRPDDDTLGSADQEPDANEGFEKNAREHIALRIEWANAVTEMYQKEDPNIRMPDVLANVTDLYARIFGKRVSREKVEADDRWQRYVREVREGADPIDLALKMRAERIDAEKKQGPPPLREFFGPFRYDLYEDENIIDIHFGSMGWSPEERDGPKDFVKNAREGLTEMFRAIKTRHPETKRVSGGSWLLRRIIDSPKLKPKLYEILPKTFVDSHEAYIVEAQGGGRWGQFVDNRGKVHERRAALFRTRMKDPEIMKPATFLKAFPISPVYMEAPIEDFYREYEID